ncbi:MAG: phosphodiester glycosidase family protein [Acidobacteria bacterium]|jgi:exopolysaccharide biosynthesis protein|nr:MAG: phosphodiester glycosidase family protein [Acidobacteriota bacterium]GIU83072.1 MAG: hypothetical protein KatS3mg006_2136 [Pyrinomonadaceae bacterium]
MAIFIKFKAVILAIFALQIYALPQDFRQVHDGIEYAEVTRGTEEAPIRINLLRLDPAKVRLDIVHALDAAIGTEKTSSIAKRHGAVAAINAGFFRNDSSIYAGDAAGILVIDGKILSESYANRVAVGIINGKSKTEVEFGHLKIEAYVTNGKEKAIISGINRERKKDEIIVFMPEFHRTTLTGSDGFEIVVTESKPRIERKGNSVIPCNGYVVSVSDEKHKWLLKSKKLKLVVKIEALEKEKQAFFSKAEDIVGGVPQLIKNGQIQITWELEKTSREFVETRHPRTAIAKLKDGKILMITVDGRQPGYSVGMTLQELAEFLLEMGATDAINLDGGGSTTMFLDGKVVNRPSDKEGERKVSDAILVFLR